MQAQEPRHFSLLRAQRLQSLFLDEARHDARSDARPPFELHSFVGSVLKLAFPNGVCFGYVMFEIEISFSRNGRSKWCANKSVDCSCCAFGRNGGTSRGINYNADRIAKG
jgi:hypothetical protein